MGRERKLIRVRGVIDESGSMGWCQGDTVQGYQDFLGMLKETPADIRVSLTVFDDKARHAYEGEYLAKAPGLEDPVVGYNAMAGGGTLLYDSFADSIDHEAKLASEVDRVIVVVITDGQDTDSRRNNAATISAKVAEKKATGRWQFVWLGPNKHTALEMGIDPNGGDKILELKGGAGAIKAAIAELTAEVQTMLMLPPPSAPSAS